MSKIKRRKFLAVEKYNNVTDSVTESVREWQTRPLDKIYPKIYFDATQSLNSSLRKVTQKRAAFPTDDSIYKVLYLAITNVSKKWTRPIKDWAAVLNQFAIYFGDRVTM